MVFKTTYLASAGNELDDKLDKIGVYFSEANNYTFVPRSVNIDLVSSKTKKKGKKIGLLLKCHLVFRNLALWTI